MRRFLTLTAVIVTALLLQTTVFADVRLLGARPELMFLLTIVFALLEGPSSGAITGFAGGMAQDFLLNKPKGITALTLTLLGYAVGLLRQYIVSPCVLVPGAASGNPSAFCTLKQAPLDQITRASVHRKPSFPLGNFSGMPYTLTDTGSRPVMKWTRST